jgi:hypothetical protein
MYIILPLEVGDTPGTPAREDPCTPVGRVAKQVSDTPGTSDRECPLSTPFGRRVACPLLKTLGGSSRG